MKVGDRFLTAIAWIALNDEPLDRNVATVSELISVLLVADVFGYEPISVAQRVVRTRELADNLNEVIK